LIISVSLLQTVSLDGTLFQKSGIISGGASNIKAKARRWDEKQVENLRRQKTKHIEEIQGLVAVRRKMSELQTLKSEVNGLESRLNYSKKDRENTANYLISKIEKEIDQINQEIQSLEPKMTRIQSSIDKRNRDLHKLESKINKVEDEIFKDFCNMIGVSNIRQYEEKQLHNQQMRSKKKLEFANQISRLENQLEYERRRDTKSIIRKLMGSIADDEKSIDALEAQEEDLLKVIESIEEVIEEKKSEKRNIQKVYEEQDIEAKELKKMLGNSIKELTSLQKQLNSIETELDQNKFDRHSLLKTCKLNDIQIPMSDGSMDDIGGGNETESNSQSTDTLDTGMEIDSTSTQGAKLLYERESKIVVDYSDLDKKYTDVNDDGELKTLAQELNLQRSRLQNMMQRMTMPNLRALDKLGDVESRLLETAAEFEQTRAMARKSKTDFARIKKKRFDDFSRAFDHVSTIIDEIYKKLCNNSSAQAFLAVENSEEPYLDGVTYNCIAPSKRYRPMDNLSGGEKTVAALALLFAIHSYQPSPFFVLDEIDAALDNTNINRVAQYITEQASEGKFQCIVISLKEEFYSHADALIGIYCEPGGECTISQMLTYDLSLHFSDLTSPTKRLKSS
jgi:structural maintenance of chromosome 1